MRKFFESITVEPTLFFFMIVQEWMRELDANLYLQKACRSNLTTEPDLNTKCDDEKRGILFVSEFYSSYNFAVTFLNMIVVIFASIWSDEAGRRRPFIFLPIFGFILQTFSGCLNSYFWQWTPSIAVVSWTVIRGICGETFLVLSFSHMYLCDISDAENRTMRLGVATAIRIVALIISKGGFGFILRSIGFFYFYALCLVLSLTSLTCGLIFIKDRFVPVKKKILFSRMFSLKRILLVDSFKVTFDRKLGIKRVIVLLLILTDAVNAFVLIGETPLLYLYLRHRFKFDERMYSKYVFSKFFLASLGILFCSFVLSKRLKIQDGLIGILATSCDTLAIIALLFATQIWQLYSVTVLDMFHGVVNLVSISFRSKYFKSDELGRLNAVNSVFFLLVPLTFPVYNGIFQRTLDTFPAAYCLLSTGLNVACLIFFIAAYVLSRKLDEKQPVPREEELMVASKFKKTFSGGVISRKKGGIDVDTQHDYPLICRSTDLIK